MDMKIFSSRSSEVNQATKFEVVECAKEMNRVRRTIGVSSRSIDQTGLSSDDSLLTKISSLHDCPVAERVGQIAGSTGISSAGNTIKTAIELLAVEKDNLENPAIPLSDEVNALFGTNEPETDKRNFLVQVNQLVAEMLQLLSKLSDRDRNKTDFSKKEYDIFNTRVAELTQKQGNWGAGVAIASFFVSAGSALTGDFGYKIGSALAGQFQPLSGHWTSGYAAESGKYSNKINLISNDLQSTSNKNDTSAWRGELLDALRNAQEALRSAVRSNG